MVRVGIEPTTNGFSRPKENCCANLIRDSKIRASTNWATSPYRQTIANLPSARATPLISSPFLGMWRSDVTAQTRVVGLEPTNMGTKIPCLTFWRHPFIARYMCAHIGNILRSHIRVSSALATEAFVGGLACPYRLDIGISAIAILSCRFWIMLVGGLEPPMRLRY